MNRIKNIQRLGGSLALPTVCLAAVAAWCHPQCAGEPAKGGDLFRRENLTAWCIVPFDAQKRGPEERAAMLERLGFKHFAYDYRAEHVPTFEAEIEACKRHGVGLDAWWFPGSLNAEAKHILELCRKHDIRPELWISGGGAAPSTPEEQQQRVKQEAARIRPIAEAAAAQGMKVGLYNHGGWFGEPENQLAIIAELKLPNVGIVYNLHHGHDQVERLPEILKKTLPYLLCVNLNGMTRQGDRRGQKILQLGQGELDLGLLRTIRASGYKGPIGILGHTQDDAEARLQDNLDGLDWLLPQLDGKPAGKKPTPRTPVPGAKQTSGASPAVPAPAVKGVGYVIAGREEYRTAPLTLEVCATLRGKSGYNILAACDTKASGRHWELFTMPASGALTVYLPGRKPDHVRSTVDVCDGKPHDLTMLYEATRVRLLVDGKLAADQEFSGGGNAKPGDLAIGRLVEGSIGCVGEIEHVRLTRGIVGASGSSPAAPGPAAQNVVGHWKFAKADAAEVPDLSQLKNPAKRSTAVAADTSKAPIPPPGVHLKPVDPRLKVTLIDRSPDQVYMGVKVDKDGHVFVGGREGVFVFEAKADGTFAPRREILRFPQDSIIMGLEFKDDDLLVLASNALYRVPQGRVQREGLKPERILWGLPLDLHVSFHCLAWGPRDGKLYITHGDPWLGYGDWTRPDHWGHWILYSKGTAKSGEPGASASDVSSVPRISKVDPAWRETPYCGQGAVLQFDVETGAIEVVATGLRGPVGLAFDNQGNLFTNDNDHEGRADLYAPAKLLFVSRWGVDFGWPRGWMASKSPDRLDLNEPVCDLGRGVPCDLIFYPERYEPSVWRQKLLMCRWDRHAVTMYQPVPRYMDGFSAVEQTILTGEENCRPVGIAVQRGGGLLVTAVYMTGNMAAPYCASDLYLVTPPQEPITSLPIMSDETHRLLNKAAYESRAKRNIAELKQALDDKDEKQRREALVQIGERLTRAAIDYVPPAELPLFYQQESAFFKRKQKFWGSDEPVDLANLARIGSFTIAQRWKALKHTTEEERLFALLVAALDDKSDAVRLQAAYYLSLLNDPRSEPLVEKTRREVQLKRLTSASTLIVRQAWTVGPFEDGDDAKLARPHPPEQGTLDLSASYVVGNSPKSWEEASRSENGVGLFALPRTSGERASWYLTFRAASASRQQALLTVDHEGAAKVWLNGAAVAERVPDRSAWIVDLQPGGNEFLVRVQTESGTRANKNVSHPSSLGIALQAPGKIELSLPEKLDSAQLAARLREAAAAGGVQPVPQEFLALDWVKEAARGEASEGRRLYGTLGCAKCHAIVPDQKSAGAPSLFEARRRFTVPHLVESMLLPSRQVAEPFRAQQIVTDDGRMLTGLVVGESADALEILLPDATRRTIGKKQIEERTTTTLSPMPQGLLKTPDELRNLLAYLMSERPTPP